MRSLSHWQYSFVKLTQDHNMVLFHIKLLICDLWYSLVAFYPSCSGRSSCLSYPIFDLKEFHKSVQFCFDWWRVKKLWFLKACLFVFFVAWSGPGWPVYTNIQDTQSSFQKTCKTILWSYIEIGNLKLLLFCQMYY